MSKVKFKYYYLYQLFFLIPLIVIFFCNNFLSNFRLAKKLAILVPVFPMPYGLWVL